MMFKFVKGSIPEGLGDMFLRNADVHNYPTRHRNQLRIPVGRSSMVQRSFRHKGVCIWNDIAQEVDHQCSLAVFKHKVKDYLLQI